MPQEEIIRKRYHFYGRVQGVGFRYVAEHAAQAARATGWVRNEYDGSVSMELQGTPAQHDRVLAVLTHGRYIHIDDFDSTATAVVPDEAAFRIRY